MEMSEEGRVSEVLQARGVVCHAVAVSWEEVCEVAVPMKALVVAGVSAECSCSSAGGHCSFADARDGRGVIGEVLESGVSGLVCGGHEVHLRQQGGVLQVAVRDRSSAVVSGHYEALDGGREGSAPQVGLPFRIEVDSTHARLGCVSGTQEGRFLGHDLGQVSGALAEAGGETAEGVEAVSDEGVDADPVSFGLVLRPLQCAEQAAGSGDGDRDEAKLAEDAGPLLGADALGVGHFFEDVSECVLAVRRQLYGLPDRIDYPAEDELPGAPAAVALQELLEGDRLVPVRFVGCRGGQHLVEGAEKMGPQSLESSLATLAKLNEVVDEDISVAYRSGVHLVRDGDVVARSFFGDQSRVELLKLGGSDEILLSARNGFA